MIRPSHDTIRIDTKGDDMIIYETIRVVFKKYKNSQYSHSITNYDHLKDKHGKWMLPLVSFTTH